MLAYNCTGVAYATSTSDSRTVTMVNSWPYTEDEVVNKVPTNIDYGGAGVSSGCTMRRWGDDKPHPNAESFFKLFLDRNMIQSVYPEDSHRWEEEFRKTQKFYSDFLSGLRWWVAQELQRQNIPKPSLDRHTKRAHPRIPSPDLLNADYVFSVPSGWTREVVEEYRALITKAGFGDSPNIGLTEAEAAAIYGAEYMWRESRRRLKVSIIPDRGTTFR